MNHGSMCTSRTKQPTQPVDGNVAVGSMSSSITTMSPMCEPCNIEPWIHVFVNIRVCTCVGQHEGVHNESAHALSHAQWHHPVMHMCVMFSFAPIQPRCRITLNAKLVIRPRHVHCLHSIDKLCVMNALGPFSCVSQCA